MAEMRISVVGQRRTLDLRDYRTQPMYRIDRNGIVCHTLVRLRHKGQMNLKRNDIPIWFGLKMQTCIY